MDNELIRLNGKFTYILFRNDANYYTVAKFRINDKTEKTITVTGTMASVQTDILYNIFGTYVEHPRYGMQFSIQSYEKPLPNERDGMIRYLSGVQFPGVGKKTAEKIVTALGEDALSMIRQDPSCLETIPDLSVKVIRSVAEGIRMEEDGMEELIRFLNVHGIGMRNLERLNRAYGKKALEKISENPYRVIEECDGFGFVTADKIAMSLGFSPDDERRLFAYLVSLAGDLCMNTGDSWISLSRLQEQFAKDTKGVESDFTALLEEIFLCGKRIVSIQKHSMKRKTILRPISETTRTVKWNRIMKLSWNVIYLTCRKMKASGMMKARQKRSVHSSNMMSRSLPVVRVQGKRPLSGHLCGCSV